MHLPAVLGPLVYPYVLIHILNCKNSTLRAIIATIIDFEIFCSVLTKELNFSNNYLYLEQV